MNTSGSKAIGRILSGRNGSGWRMGLWLLGLALLVSCGGGGQYAGGVGTGGTGAGTVSGFGSVIVDGVRYDDTDSLVSKANADGWDHNATVLLGQQVRVDFDGSQRARHIWIRPQLVGVVTQTVGALEVNGLPVQVVDDTSALGKATLLAGYGQLADIKVDDEVDVHGFWVVGVDGKTSLIATRFEKTAQNPDSLLVSGLLSEAVTPCGAAACVHLNADTPGLAGGVWFSVAVDSACATGLQVDEAVQVTLARAVSLPRLAAHTSSKAAPLLATTCERVSLRQQDLGNGVLRISGLPAQFDGQSNALRINGTLVQLPTLSETQKQALQQSTYVALDAAPATGGSGLWTHILQLRDVSQIDVDATGIVTRVSGTLHNTGIDWASTSGVSFSLRNVSIQASSEVVASSGCRNFAAGTDLRVSVAGRLSTATQQITATSLSCSLVSLYGSDVISNPSDH